MRFFSFIALGSLLVPLWLAPAVSAQAPPPIVLDVQRQDIAELSGELVAETGRFARLVERLHGPSPFTSDALRLADSARQYNEAVRRGLPRSLLQADFVHLQHQYEQMAKVLHETQPLRAHELVQHRWMLIDELFDSLHWEMTGRTYPGYRLP